MLYLMAHIVSVLIEARPIHSQTGTALCTMEDMDWQRRGHSGLKIAGVLKGMETRSS